MDWSNLANTATGGLFGAIGSLITGKQQYNNQSKLAAQQFQYQQQLQQQQNDYNTMMWEKTNEYNSAANQVSRYAQAGLNPGMMMSGQNATAAQQQSSASPSFSMPSWNQPAFDLVASATALVSSIANAKKANADAKRAEAEANEVGPNAESSRTLQAAQAFLASEQSKTEDPKRKEFFAKVDNLLIEKDFLSQSFDARLDALVEAARSAGLENESKEIANKYAAQLNEENINLLKEKQKTEQSAQAANYIQVKIGNSQVKVNSATVKSILAQCNKTEQEALKVAAEKDYQQLTNAEKRALQKFWFKFKYTTEGKQMLQNLHNSREEGGIKGQENKFWLMKMLLNSKLLDQFSQNDSYDQLDRLEDRAMKQLLATSYSGSKSHFTHRNPSTFSINPQSFS